MLGDRDPTSGAASAEHGSRPANVRRIVFANGNRATIVRAQPRQSAVDVVAAAELGEPCAVLLVVGGAKGLDGRVEPLVRRMFEGGVTAALETTGAVVVDGGTDRGVMAVAGQALAASGLPLTLVGVAPGGLVAEPSQASGDGPATTGAQSPTGSADLEPNHSHFILASTDKWGGETRLLLEVVETIAGSRPIAVLVAGGGDVTRTELLGATGRAWPIVVLAGSGGVAADVAEADDRRRRTPTAPVDDPGLATIVDQTIVTIVPPDAEPAVLERILTRRLQDDSTLRMAWQRYATLSRAAKQQQRSFRALERAILGLGVLVTTLVVIQIILQRNAGLPDDDPLPQVVHYAIVIIPITVAALFAMSARLRPGSRWVQLRGTAETIKREIFRYRARAGRYAPARSRTTSREIKLADAVASAMTGLMQTDVNLAVLDDVELRDPAADHTAEGDDGYGPLSAETYIRFRIDDQIAYYQRGIRRRGRQVLVLRWIMLLVGGLGTVLAAALLEPWVAVTTALIGATATYLEAMQLESTIMLQNQAAVDLGAIRAWWMALSVEEQATPRVVDRLVNHAERIMGVEHAGWIQEMRDAITQLRVEATDSPASSEPVTEPGRDSEDAPPAVDDAEQAGLARG